MRSPPQSEQDVTNRVSGTYVAEKRVAGIQIDSDHQGDGAAGFFFADITQDGYEGHLRDLKAALASAYRAGYAAGHERA